ncbi:MAG: single-stranded DNA-binding protein [Acidobacteriota bacterium]|nr:single-stranded DNA-binding protein [Acidobacteriota bacterium]
MLNLNRITLIGNTGTDAKTTPNGPTTLSLATTSAGPTPPQASAAPAPAPNGTR